MKGDLILVKHRSLLGRLIRKITKSNFNHVGIFIDDDRVIEAKFSGVVVTPFATLQRAKRRDILDFEVYRIKNVKKEQIEIMVNFIGSQVGRKYDFVQFFSLGLMLLFHITRRVEPIDIRRRWICSELVAEGAYLAGIRFHENIDPDNITPEDIASSSLVERVNI